MRLLNVAESVMQGSCLSGRCGLVYAVGHEAFKGFVVRLLKRGLDIYRYSQCVSVDAYKLTFISDMRIYRYARCF